MKNRRCAGKRRKRASARHSSWEGLFGRPAWPQAERSRRSQAALSWGIEQISSQTLLRDQHLVFQRSLDPVEQVVHAGRDLHVAAIEAPSHLIDVAVKMLGRHPVVDADDLPL